VTAEAWGQPRRPSTPPLVSTGRIRLGPAEAAVFETFVVPRYLSLFGELAIEMLLESEQARIVHLHCRTGYPDRGIALKLPASHIIGTDPSPAALQLARAKAATMPAMVAEYRVVDDPSTALPDSAFSHGLTLHPPVQPAPRDGPARSVRADDLDGVIAELARLLAPHGQLLVAMPLQGSFQELSDLLREYALKYSDAVMAKAVEEASLARPTVEGLTGRVERAGFELVDIALRQAVLRFQSGRDFFEDPVTRFVIVPEMKMQLGLDDVTSALSYVSDAIDKYYSEGMFELTVNVACATGRRRP
jgi:SAM-dependent methyltransferase